MKYLLFLSLLLVLLPGTCVRAQETSSLLTENDALRIRQLLEERGEKSLSPAEFQVFSDKFAQISARNPAAWLPLYYTGLMAIGSVFEEHQLTLTPAMISEQCERVEKMLNRCAELGAPEDEVLVLRALISYGRIRGGGSVSINGFIAKAALEEALEMDPLNPRIYSLLGQYVYFAPQRLGGGPEAAMAYFETALVLFDTEHPAIDSPTFILPHWGKPRAMRYLQRCKKGELITYDERMKGARYETTCY